MGHEGRAGVKDGKDRDEDDKVDVWCFLERKTAQHRTEKMQLEMWWEEVDWGGIDV